ncbi:RNA polymerase, sigma-24 subunit, ECF subfamily [Alkaliphilus metalliredigens QYMF]|uniref:RNA polymerase, sigma-24 subunit, ECF subfamily n=1 Tax=Alkaliphilus metalliredigens (strain QYMF) TaxID=293826 RepID=A6TSU8_ALKMQ|nr:RNA polymerase, sigma-24 subunit, ECF subfamily [Alkaliphilus metalliredigens QYMF]
MKTLNQQEATLIEKSKDGDSESFEKLILQHQKKAFNIAYRMLGNLEDANDVTQEALLKAYRAINRFQEKSSFSTWLYTIVTNTCVDFIRKNRKTKVVYLDREYEGEEGQYKREVYDDENGPEELLEKKEVQRLIHDAINLLNYEQRKVIILRDIEGFSYREIAEILDCAEGTIKSRINRARSNLKNLITEKIRGKEGYHEL